MKALTPAPRYLTSCERGPADRRPVLCISWSAGAPSVLLVKLPPGFECHVHLAPRYKRLLLAAVDAWHADDGEIEILRGFRTAAELGALYGELFRAGAPLSEKAVRAYVHEIKVRIVKGVSSFYPHQRIGIQVPVLLEARRAIGYRIGESGLEIARPRRREVSDN
jgi:hypothetical protein